MGERCCQCATLVATLQVPIELVERHKLSECGWSTIHMYVGSNMCNLFLLCFTSFYRCFPRKDLPMFSTIMIIDKRIQILLPKWTFRNFTLVKLVSSVEFCWNSIQRKIGFLALRVVCFLVVVAAVDLWMPMELRETVFCRMWCEFELYGIACRDGFIWMVKRLGQIAPWQQHTFCSVHSFTIACARV